MFSFFRETSIHYAEKSEYFPMLSVRILKCLGRVFFGTGGLYLLLCWKHPEHDRFFRLDFSQILDGICNGQLQNRFHRSDHSLHSHKGKDLPLMQKNRQLNKLLLQSTSPFSCVELKQLEKRIRLTKTRTSFFFFFNYKQMHIVKHRYYHLAYGRKADQHTL